MSKSVSIMKYCKKISNTLSTRRFGCAIKILEIQEAAKLTETYIRSEYLPGYQLLTTKVFCGFQENRGTAVQIFTENISEKLQIKAHRHKYNY